MNNLYATDYVVFDLETTGRVSSLCEIIEIAALKVRDNVVVDTFSELVKPSGIIPEEICKLTGITNEMVSDKPDIENILPKFIDFIGNDILVGQNIKAYDLVVLQRVLGYQLRNDCIDLMDISRKVFPIGTQKLKCIAGWLDITVNNAHRAMDDCDTTYRCYEKFKLKYYKNDEFVTDQRDIHIEKEISEKNICLSGSFLIDRKKVEAMLEAEGATIKNDVSKKIAYLIMGTYEESDWKSGTIGTKYQKYKEKGFKENGVKVLYEFEFFNIDKPSNFQDYIKKYDPDYNIDAVEPDDEIEQVVTEADEIPENVVTLMDKIREMLEKNDYRTNDIEIRKSQAKQNNKKITFMVSPREDERMKYAEYQYDVNGKFKILTDKKFSSIVSELNFKKRSDDMIQLEFSDEEKCCDVLYKLTLEALNKYSPSYKFGCCSKYVECSDAKKCLHKDKLHANGCAYNSNLKEGRIFYGKNKTIL